MTDHEFLVELARRSEGMTNEELVNSLRTIDAKGYGASPKGYEAMRKDVKNRPVIMAAVEEGEKIVPGHPDYRYAVAEKPMTALEVDKRTGRPVKFRFAKPAMAAATAAKYSKVPVVSCMMARFPRAIQEIAKVSVFGCEKHKVPLGDLSFMDLPGAATMYRDAEGRHMLAEVIEGPINHADGDLYHKAQKAWNAMADLEVFLRQRHLEEEA